MLPSSTLVTTDGPVKTSVHVVRSGALEITTSLVPETKLGVAATPARDTATGSSNPQAIDSDAVATEGAERRGTCSGDAHRRSVAETVEYHSVLA